jgi:hypothetical protein
MAELKWSRLEKYPNGSVDLYHNNRVRGRVTIHLERGQTVAQYIEQHGRLPNYVPPPAPPVDPRIAAARLAAHRAKLAAAQAAAPTYGNKYDLVGLRRGLNELGKPWGMSKNSFNSALRKQYEHPWKNFKKPSLTIRKRNMNLFSGKLETLGWKKVVNGPEFRQFHKTIRVGATGMEGFLLALRGSNSNNFRGKTQVHAKIPVITP